VGVDRDGAFAEYVCIPATNVIRVDPSIPDEIISFFDAFGNATHTALTYDVVGQDVLLTGAGPIGIMAGAICRKNGARNVVITDVNDYRLALAEKMGCTPCNVKTQKLEDVMEKLKIHEGFDIGYEMSGAPSALNQMLKNMYNGGQIALLGIANPTDGINWNEVIFKGLTVHGVYGRKMFETWYMMEAMVLGGLDLSPMITHRYNYRDYEKGFEAMISGKSGKVILDWTK
jgi:threonine 3-dehydrogenase